MLKEAIYAIVRAAVFMKEKRSEDESFVQPELLQFAEAQSPETVLERVVVETMPIFRQQKAGSEWSCQVHAPSDIFHQERNEHYQLRARAYAREAQRQRLRPGDIVTLHGIPSSQEIETTAGEKRRIYHFTVTKIEVLSRSKRISLTVYEKQRGK
jgi:hypothetical protein